MCENCWTEHPIPDPVPCVAGIMLGLIVEREGEVTRAQAQAYLSQMNTRPMWDLLIPYLDDLEQKILQTPKVIVLGALPDDPANIVYHQPSGGA